MKSLSNRKFRLANDFRPNGMPDDLVLPRINLISLTGVPAKRTGQVSQVLIADLAKSIDLNGRTRPFPRMIVYN